MSISLKTQLENRIASTILTLVGKNSPSPDPNLPVTAGAIESTASYLLMEQDKKNGPLLRTKLMSLVQTEEETGQGLQGRGAILNGSLRVMGISGNYKVFETATEECAILEELVRYGLMREPLIGVFSSLDGSEISYAVTLSHSMTQFDEITTTAQQSSPKIGAPVANASNTGSGSLAVDSTQLYLGGNDTIFAIVITTANSSPGTVSGATFQWIGSSGILSSPTAITGGFQPLENGVSIQFSLPSGGSFVVGDRWTISATARGLDFAAVFTQDWNVTLESISGYEIAQTGGISAPTALTATPQAFSILLSWSDSLDAPSYKVWRQASSETSGTILGITTAQEFTDSGVISKTTYSYWITSLFDLQESGRSNIVTVTAI